MIRYVVALLMMVCVTAWAGDSGRMELQVKGMHCDRCADKVKSAIRKVSDVENVEVDLKKGTAQVLLVSDAQTSPGVLAKAIAEAGYGVTYKDGNETKSLEAIRVGAEDEDCMEQANADDNADCATKAKSDCCKEKETKGKMKRK